MVVGKIYKTAEIEIGRNMVTATSVRKYPVFLNKAQVSKLPINSLSHLTNFLTVQR